MIHVRSFRTAGKCHGFDISRCQDQIRILSDATQTTIVLCDGAGSSPYGGIAASVTASILARNLHSNFEQYLHNALPDIKMQLTRTINNELKKMAKEMQIAPRKSEYILVGRRILHTRHFHGQKRQIYRCTSGRWMHIMEH